MTSAIGNTGRSFRTFLVIGIARLSVTLCSVASVGISTAVLHAEGMGVMNLVLSAVNLFALVIGAISLYFYRQLVAWQREGRLADNLLRYAVFLLGAGAVAGLLSPLVYFGETSPWKLITPTWLAILLAGNIVVTSLTGALLYTLNTLGQRTSFALLSNLASWGGVGLAWAATHIGPARAEIWMAGLLLAQLLTLLLSSWALMKSLSPRSSTLAVVTSDGTENFGPVAVFRFAWPLVICNALYWLQRNSFSPWLVAEAGAASLGLFSVAFSLGMLAMSSFDTLFRELYGPTYYRATAHANRSELIDAWQRYALAFFPMLTVVVALVGACGDSLLALLTAPQFHGLGKMALWGAISQFWISIYATFIVLASSFMDNRVLIVPNVIGGVVTCVLLLGSPVQDPMIGAAIAVNAGLASTAAAAGLALHRLFAPALPWRKVAMASLAALPLWALSHMRDLIVWPEHPIAGAVVTVALASGYAMALLHRLSRAWLRSVL